MSRCHPSPSEDSCSYTFVSEGRSSHNSVKTRREDMNGLDDFREILVGGRCIKWALDGRSFILSHCPRQSSNYEETVLV